MNLDEMRSYIRSVVDIDVTDISDDVMARMLSEGYDHIVYYKKRWPFYEVETTFTTSAGVKDYSLATVGASIAVTHNGSSNNVGLREVSAIRIDKEVLEYVGRDEGDIMYPLSVSSNGDPYYWAFWGDSVRLYPTPAGAMTVTVRGYRNPVAFGVSSGAASTPDFPEPFQRLLTTYGLARAYHQQEDAQMANQYMGMFSAELDNLAARYDDAPAPQPIILNARNASRWKATAGHRLRYSWE